MRLFVYLLRHGRGLMIMALLASAVSGLSSAALIGVISQQLSYQNPLTPLRVTYFGVIILLVSGADLVAKWLLIRLGTQSTYLLCVELAQRILQTPLRQLELIGNPQLVAALVDDVRSVAVALNRLPTICIGLTIIAGCTLYLSWLSPLLFLLLSGLTAPALYVHYQLQRRAKQAMHAVLLLRNARDDNFAALTQGAKELQLNRRRRLAFMEQIFEPTLLAMQKENMTNRLFHALAQGWIQSVYFIYIVVTMGLAHLIGVDLALLTSYAVTALYMKNSLSQVLAAIPQWNEAVMAFQKLETLQLAPLLAEDLASRSMEDHRPADKLHRQSPSTLSEPSELQQVNSFVSQSYLRLELSQITHCYTNDRFSAPFTLGPLSLHLSSGELLFITGANGSGKSTLLKVLTGIYEPAAGEILLNGSKVAPQNRQAYREHFSVVFSDFYLFDQLLGMEDEYVDQQAMHYLSQFQLQHKVTVQQGCLSTFDLSQGQRKRLALLTAYLEDRPIYLFDEWAANQDPSFKELFYRELLPELAARGKLVIVITHDDQYFSLADRLLRLENGQLIEEIHSPHY